MHEVSGLVDGRHWREGFAARSIAAFIWIAENLATFAGAWAYPHQIAA
jgi:uncharacterized membrane protein YoaT (DUF817 family)